MLLAPFTLIETPSRHIHKAGPRVASVPAWLLAWAIFGGIAVLCVPALRGGPTTGLTLPFWLVGAPVVNILWLTRKQWWAVVGQRSARILSR